MEGLLATQSQIITGMDQLLTNFKKDGPERRSKDYILRRLDTLDSYWQEFQVNHIKLCEFGDKTGDYFVGDHYNKTKEFYQSAREYIIQKSAPILNPSTPVSSISSPANISSNVAQKPILRPATPLATTSSVAEAIDAAEGSSRDSKTTSVSNILKMVSHGTNSHLDELLRKQSSNFKAFSRTVSSINIDLIMEQWEFQDALKTLESRWSVIDNLHWELDSQLNGENELYEQTFSANEATYHRMKKLINKKLWSVSHREKYTPKVEVSVFHGTYNSWISFKDLFTETIHNNPSLSSAQKMQFLKSKVKGEAERLIQHLPISSENYAVCWEILNHRYNNVKLIFSSHANMLMNLPVMQQATVNHIKRIHDTTQESLNAIKNLGVDVTTWDPLLVHILTQKLDTDTHNEYLSSLKKPRELPSLSDFLNFLEGKFTSMEASRRKQENISNQNKSYLSHHQSGTYQNPKSNQNHKSNNLKQSFSSNKVMTQYIGNKNMPVTRPIKVCPNCKKDHILYNCAQFVDMSPRNKLQLIKKLKICENCLYDHYGKACFSTSRCRECNGCHNSILHDAFLQTSTSNNSACHSPESGHQPRPSNSFVSQQEDFPEILLATAMIWVQMSDGSYAALRALLDQGSQTNLITEKAAQMLNLPRQQYKGVITGVGVKENNCKGMLNINCMSMVNSYSFDTEVFIMNHVTRNLPNISFHKPQWTHLEKIQLADPEFYRSRPIDLLLGAEVFSNILLDGVIRFDRHISPIAQQTRLGWILSGGVKTLQCNVVQIDIKQFQKFWEVEDISVESSLSEEEKECITFYQNTTRRLENGRYEVRIPLKPAFEQQLGDSKSKAIAQFRQLERKLIKNEKLSTQYKLFMEEYESSGHMKPADCNQKPESFLPHHGVIREDSTTTKLRVVFNASAKTSTGLSLNDLMYTGPNLQQDLQSLILGWRQHRFAFSADVEKMFRQIMVNEADQKLQKIIWREHPNQPLQEYQLTTVTYGTKAAPFLAMMTLRQLAADERAKYPEAADAIQGSFYMDDILHGTGNITSCKQLQQDLIDLLQSGGFKLHKWASNNNNLLRDSINGKQDDKEFKHVEATKTLGLRWNPDQDTLSFSFKIDSSNRNTKRSVLSEISKVFDPLGWITPLTTKLKIMFQTILTLNLGWDDTIPENYQLEWNIIKADILNIINQFKIPRWLGTEPLNDIEFHGYSDSSMKSYACVIYCKISKQSETSITLVAGKSRLVPTSQKLSLPKLELCGAFLLSKLMAKVKRSLPNYKIKTYGWVDSTAVLGWLHGDPRRWKTFVSNRVQQICDVMPSECWRYVKSEENPADCASRGLTASQLLNHPLWWQGPIWLPSYNDDGNKKITYTTVEEMKPTKNVNIAIQQNKSDDVITELLKDYSSFPKIVRILAWVYRFINNSKKQSARQKLDKERYITLSELRRTKTKIIIQTQQEHFLGELNQLKISQTVSNKSKLQNLNPFLDKEGLLRVGGRLKHAHISYEMQHPIILPNNSRLTELIIDHFHQLTFHGGARLTLAFIRQKYWLLGGNRATKKRIFRCVTCRKHNPLKQNQIMADFPESRCNPARPFSEIGVDFSGYIFLKINKGRGVKTTKGYVAVFVCMATKAVHLEVVSDLTTSAFIAALRRMIARRGKPSRIYSDNGGNFVGANRILKMEYQHLQQVFSNDFLAEISEMEIKWSFNAGAWPSAGGLWESVVKSFKFHLKRVIGEQKLTYEELSTVLAQIEGCLNSRPLCPLSEDPEDLDFLTPSHFLTGGSALTLFDTEKDMRTRWHLSQQIFRDIWKRWRSEYLTQLSARSKWRESRCNISLNDVVIIHDDNLPPGKWAMGRVIELHPGSDGKVRVVSLKTKNGVIKRPIIKLSILPVHAEALEDQSENNHISQNNHRNQSDATTSYKRKREGRKPFSFVSLVISLLFSLSILSSSEATLNITKFRKDQSLYFDKLANMQTIRDEWKLVIYYNMEPYWEGINALNKYTQSLNQTCNTIKTSSHCNVILLQLHHGANELEYYNHMLLGQQYAAQTTSRQRRGLIDGVGYVANSLFGVLDQRFADKYEKDISLLRNNQVQLMTFWKNQTSVVEAEYNLLKRTEESISRQHKLINQHINGIEHAINSLQNLDQINSLVNEFTLASLIASNLLGNLKTIQGFILDTMTDIYHGRFNPHLFSPEQLQNELSTIAGHLASDVSLPIQNIYTDLSKIYKLFQAKARMLQSYLIFEITLPLISRDSFEIFKVISIPEIKNNHMIKIKPISDFIAISLRKNMYITMTEEDIKSCFMLEPYLCYIKTPIYHLKSDQDLCKIKGSECETIVSNCENSWLESNNINTYIYFCCDQCPVRSMCGDQVTPQVLSQTGLVTTDNGCELKTDAFSIFSRHKHMSELQITPDLYTPVVAPINHIINITIPRNSHNLELNTSIYDHEKLAEIGANIKFLKEHPPALPDGISTHDVHHYALIYAIVGVMLLLGVVYLARRTRCSWRVSAGPPAMARPPVAACPRAAEQAPAAAETLSPPAPAPRARASSFGESVLYQCVNERTKEPSARVLNKNTSPLFHNSFSALNIADK